MTIQNQKIRFALVGAGNTALDFGLFLALSQVLAPVVANYISTTTCLIISFFLNRSYTFAGARGNKLHRQIILFFAFSLVALWIFQPLIIALTTNPLKHITWLPGIMALAIAKGLATVVSLTWNYLTYSRFVFPDND